MAELHSGTSEYRKDTDALKSVDVAIIEMLHDGRNNAPNIADDADYSKQYIRERLGRLREDNIVETIGSGIYELRSDPRESESDE